MALRTKGHPSYTPIPPHPLVLARVLVDASLAMDEAEAEWDSPGAAMSLVAASPARDTFTSVNALMRRSACDAQQRSHSTILQTLASAGARAGLLAVPAPIEHTKCASQRHTRHRMSPMRCDDHPPGGRLPGH